MVLENGRFTREQIKLPEHLEQPTLSDFVPGMVAYVPAEAFIVDDLGRCFLNGAIHLTDDFAFDKQYIRVVGLEEGLVVDQVTNPLAPTHFSKTSLAKLVLQTAAQEKLPIDEQNLLPVIAMVVNPQQIMQLDAAFKQQTGRHYLPKKVRKTLLSEPAQAPTANKDKSKTKAANQSTSLLE